VKAKGAQSGVTLIELMVGLAILGVLTVVALPSFTALIISTRLSGQTNELIGDLSFARSEASTRQAQVAMCMSSDQSSCTTTGTWAQGRIIFVDSDANGTRDTGSASTEAVLRVSQRLSGGTAMTATNFGSTTVVRFRPFGGMTPSTPGSFKLCPSSGNQGRLVSVAATGRPTPTTTTCP
jgi:type IV fimbrial biogenesis protein FimT